MPNHQRSIQQLNHLLSEDVINLEELRKFCFNGESPIPFDPRPLILLLLFCPPGIPDCNGLRPLCWKILLGYLLPEKSTWSKTLEKKRRLYRQLIQELIVEQEGKNREEDVASERALELDHPLSEGGAWNTFFKDNSVLLQIDKDVRRLCPDISFFQQATHFPCATIVNGGREARVHSRVKPMILSSANVERRGLEVTKVSDLIG